MRDLVLQVPKTPQQLIILLHGVGSSPEHLRPIGQLIARNHPDALVVAVAAPFTDQRGMSQWFSVQQVTEENRPSRVSEAMPSFLEALEPWLAKAKMTGSEIILFGFSQGGIMLLEAAKTSALNGCQILVCATRFATLPSTKLDAKRIGWIHGQADPLFPVALAQQAVNLLNDYGQEIELMLVPGMQHELSAQVLLDWVARGIKS